MVLITINHGYTTEGSKVTSQTKHEMELMELNARLHKLGDRLETSIKRHNMIFNIIKDLDALREADLSKDLELSYDSLMCHGGALYNIFQLSDNNLSIEEVLHDIQQKQEDRQGTSGTDKGPETNGE